MNIPRRSAFLALTLCVAIDGASAADLTPANATRFAQSTMRDYFALLALPNDAIVPSDIQKNADWLEAAFRRHGFSARQLANDGKPMVFAALSDVDPTRKNVLFYMHLDGQPVIPSQWQQQSPWTPVLKRAKTNGDWEPIRRRSSEDPPLRIDRAVEQRCSVDVPDQAVAELDLRTTPDSDAKYLGALIVEHIQRQGYHLVVGMPTDDDRTRYDKLASFAYATEGTDAAGTPIDSALGQWAYGAMVETFGPDPAQVRIRMMGGTVPTAEIVEALHVPFLIVPLVNADDNQHAANENMRMGNYIAGVRAIYGLLTTPLRP